MLLHVMSQSHSMHFGAHPLNTLITLAVLATRCNLFTDYTYIDTPILRAFHHLHYNIGDRKSIIMYRCPKCLPLV